VKILAVEERGMCRNRKRFLLHEHSGEAIFIRGSPSIGRLCLSLSLTIVPGPLGSWWFRLLLYVWPSIYCFSSSDSHYLTEIGGNLKEKDGEENSNNERL
jgi:hypothetical protein